MTDHVLRSRVHDLALWLLPHTARWPKRLRYALAQPVEVAAVALAVDLAEAETRRGRVRAEALARADGRLMGLRALLRLARDLGLLSSGAYEYVAERLDEVGRLLGGWMRRETHPPRAATDAGATVVPTT